MDAYFLEGVILPERAPLTHKFGLKVEHFISGNEAKVEISILLNKVAVWVDSDIEWDIFDLRNLVEKILQDEVAIIGFLEGYAYDVEITRVLNRSVNIDYVFGIDIPCLTQRNRSIDKERMFSLIRQKSTGREGILFHRCFSDLVLAMKYPGDTGFYCYRAIESLRQHCAEIYKIPPENKSEQWKKLREVVRCDETTIRDIKAAGDSARHGGIANLTSLDREKLFISTWNVVDAYIQHI